MMRRDVHLTAEEITAWRDGGEADAQIYRHVLACDLCRLRLAEALVSRHLLRSSQGTPVGAHLTAGEIGQYLDAMLLGEALPPQRRRAIEAHLDTCAGCLKRLLDLRAGLMPPKSLRAQVLRRLSTEEASTGRLTVRILAFADRLLMQVLDPMWPDTVWPDTDAASRVPSPLDVAPAATAAVQCLKMVSPARKRGRPMGKTRRPKTLRARERLSWSGSDVDLACVVEKGRARLDVTVTEHRSGSKRSGTPISMAGWTSGSLSESTTDRHGQASLPLPAEPVVLKIGTTPPLELEIDFQQLAFL